MTLALTAAEIDALAKKAEEPFDYHFSTLFRKEADAQGVSSEKAEAFRLIGSALGFHFRANDPVHPFGDVEALTVEQAARLESIAPQIQTAQIRARLADVAWMRTRRTPASARLAVAAYVASARALEDPQQWTECANRVERAARLSRSLGMQDESFAAVSAYLLERQISWQRSFVPYREGGRVASGIRNRKSGGLFGMHIKSSVARPRCRQFSSVPLLP
jgi:hypothetical protein